MPLPDGWEVDTPTLPKGWEVDNGDATAVPKPSARSLAGELKAAVKSGGLRALAAPGQAMQWFDKPGGIDVVRNLGTRIVNKADEIRAAHAEELAPSREGGFGQALYQAGESAPSSIASGGPAIAGALIGGGVGSAVPVIGTGLGAVIGGAVGALSSYPIMHGSQAQQTYEEGIKAGLTEPNARAAASRSGFYEAAPEALGNLAEGLLFSNPISKTVKTGVDILRPLAKPAAKEILKGIAKTMGKTVVVENATEMVTAAGQAATARDYGIRPDADPLNEALAVVPSTTLLSLGLGGLGGGVQTVRATRMKNALEDPTISKERRFEAAATIAQEINKYHPDLAAQWAQNANAHIEAGTAIPLDTDAMLRKIQAGIERKVENPDSDLIENFNSDYPEATQQMVEQVPGYNPEAPFPTERAQGVERQLAADQARRDAFDSANPVIPSPVETPAPLAHDYEGVKNHLESNQFFEVGQKNGKPVTRSDFTAALQQSYPSLVGTPKGDVISALNAQIKGRKLTEKQQGVIDKLNVDLDRYQKQTAFPFGYNVPGYEGETAAPYADLTPEEQALADANDAHTQAAEGLKDAPKFSVKPTDLTFASIPRSVVGSIRSILAQHGPSFLKMAESITDGEMQKIPARVWNNLPGLQEALDKESARVRAKIADPTTPQYIKDTLATSMDRRANAIRKTYLANYVYQAETQKFSTTPAPATLDLKTIQRSFPGQKVTATPDGHEVSLKNGSKVRVTAANEIQFNVADAEAGLGRKLKAGEKPVASWQTMPGGGVITLTEAGVGELDHEVFHTAMALALSKGERTAVLKKHGSEENAAVAYKEFRDAGGKDTFFQKVKDFFLKVRDMFVKDADTVFRMLASGKAWEQASPEQRRDALAKFMTAWHGSPHDHDKFSTEKIGTGEGAQAYGYGPYFAGSKQVAEWYKEKLSAYAGPTFYKDGAQMTRMDVLKEYYKPGRIVNGYGSRDKVLEFKETNDGWGWGVKVQAVNAEGEPLRGERPRWHSTEPDSVQVEKTLKSEGVEARDPGRLYQVELAPKEDEYLLWDKPLSEQSEKVRGALGTPGAQARIKAGLAARPDEYRILEGVRHDEGLTGKEIYEDALDGWNEGKKAASEYLHSLGIRGIKYLDGTSRGKGEGNYNYVIFNDEDVTITAKFSFGLDKVGKALATTKWGGRVDRIVSYFMPMDRIFDSFKERADLAPVKDLITSTAKEYELQTAVQDDHQTEAGLRLNKAFEATGNMTKVGGADVWYKQDEGRAKQLNSVMQRGRLWGFAADKELAEQDWSDETWEAGRMPAATGLSLKAAFGQFKAEFNRMTPEMQAAYLSLRDFNRESRDDIIKIRERIIGEMTSLSDETRTNLIERIRKQFQQVKGDYFTLGRMGEYVVSIKTADLVDEQGNIIKRGEVVGSARYNDKADYLAASNLAVADPLSFAQALPGARADLDQKGDLVAVYMHAPAQSRLQANIPQQFIEKLKGLVSGIEMKDLRKELRAIQRDLTKGIEEGSIAVPDGVTEVMARLSKAQTHQAMEQAQKDLEKMLGNHAQEQALLGEVHAAIDAAGMTAEIAEALKEDFDQAYLAALPETSIMKNYVKSKNLPGFNEDMLHSFAVYHQKFARTKAFATHGRKISDGLALMEKRGMGKDKTFTGEVSPEQSAAIGEFAKLVRDRQQAVLTEKVSPAIRKLTKFPFLWYMTSPSVLLVQSTQPFTVTHPFLAARFGQSKSMASIMKAYQRQFKKEFTDDKLLAFNEQHRELIRKLKDPALSEKDINALTSDLSLKDKEMLAMALTPSLNISLSHEEMEFAMSGETPNNRAAEKLGLFMSVSEAMSRKAGFLASFGLKYQATGDFAAALDLGTEAVRQTLFSYSQANRPAVLTGSTGRFFGQFQIFRLQMVSHIAKLAQDSVWFNNLSKEERSQARRELTTLLGMHFVVGGAMGVPVAGNLAVLFMKAFHGLFGDDDEPYDAEEELKKALGDGAIAKGVPAWVGMDLSKRVGAGGIASLFQSKPPEKAKGAELAGWYAMQLAGPTFSTLANGYVAAGEAFETGEWSKALAKVGPKLIRDPMRAYQMSTEGVVTAGGKTVIPAEDLNVYQVGLAALGVNPLEMALKSEEAGRVARYSAQVSERRALLVSKFAEAVLDGDQEDVDKAVDRVIKFNETMPAYGLKASDLVSGAKRLQMKKMGIDTKAEMKNNVFFGDSAETEGAM